MQLDVIYSLTSLLNWSDDHYLTGCELTEHNCTQRRIQTNNNNLPRSQMSVF